VTRVALGQVDALVGDVAGNAARVAEAIRAAAGAGADLAVFPELVVTGYPPDDLLRAPELVAAAGAAVRELAGVAPELPVVLGSVVPGPPDAAGRRLRNAAVVLEGGRVRTTRAKALLPRDDVFFEPRWFAADEGPARPLDLAGRRVGLLVCEDLWDEGHARSPAAELTAARADLLLCLNASPFRRGVLDERLRRARRPGRDLVYVNAVGGQDDLVFDGQSFAVDAAGHVRSLLPCAEEAVRVVDLAPGPPGLAPEPLPEAEAVRRVLCLGVADFAAKNRLPGAVVGVSGGVDSALVLALAVDALGPERVRAVHLPSRHTSARSTRDARALCRALRVELDEVPLEPLHAAGEATLAEHLPGGLAGPPGARSLENFQARLRGLLLMAWVNRRGGLLLACSNQTELALGYATLYGDLAGGLAPIGDLTKPEVYALARAGYADAIPPSILERPPTAELAPDQVDPFDYARAAPTLRALTQGDAALPTDPELAEHEARLHRAEFKRRQAPPILKLTDRAFGPGRRIPITHGLRPAPRPAPERSAGKGATATARPRGGRRTATGRAPRIALTSPRRGTCAPAIEPLAPEGDGPEARGFAPGPLIGPPATAARGAPRPGRPPLDAPGSTR